MSFATYTDLTDAIAFWLNRGDLSARIPDFIRLAEARMMRELRAFSTRVSDFALPISATTGQTSALPTPVEILQVGWRVFDAALAFNPPTPLPQVGHTQLMLWHKDVPRTGEPQAYALTGQTVTVYPFPDVPKDSTGANSFYQVLADLIGPTLTFAMPINAANYASNPVLAQYPDLYLYGALVESAPFLMHDERLPVWEQRYAKAVREVRVQDDRLAYGSRDFFRSQPVVF